ncbi:MAG: hypothetical protein NVSMB57_09660 [Actinomycetota bacterium]
MQVYLPEDLYNEVKKRGLPASELLQRSIRAEVRIQAAESETDRYLTDVIAEVGEPSAKEWEEAKAFVHRLAKRPAKRRRRRAG